MGKTFQNNLHNIFQCYQQYFRKNKIGGDIATIATEGLSLNMASKITNYSESLIKKLRNMGTIY